MPRQIEVETVPLGKASRLALAVVCHIEDSTDPIILTASPMEMIVAYILLTGHAMNGFQDLTPAQANRITSAVTFAIASELDPSIREQKPS